MRDDKSDALAIHTVLINLCVYIIHKKIIIFVNLYQKMLIILDILNLFTFNKYIKGNIKSIANNF